MLTGEETAQTVVETAWLVTVVRGLVVYGQLVTVGAQEEMVMVSVLYTVEVVHGAPVDADTDGVVTTAELLQVSVAVTGQ